MNTVVLSGRLTRDPELRTTPSGMDVASFSLAVDRAGDKEEAGGTYEAGFFDVTVFGKQADNVGRYLTKGSRAAVTGQLKHHRWEAQDGTKRSRVEITANWVEFLDTKADREAREESGNQFVPSGNEFVPAGASRGADADFTGTDDDIPF